MRQLFSLIFPFTADSTHDVVNERPTRSRKTRAGLFRWSRNRQRDRGNIGDFYLYLSMSDKSLQRRTRRTRRDVNMRTSLLTSGCVDRRFRLVREARKSVYYSRANIIYNIKKSIFPARETHEDEKESAVTYFVIRASLNYQRRSKRV